MPSCRGYRCHAYYTRYPKQCTREIKRGYGETEVCGKKYTLLQRYPDYISSVFVGFLGLLLAFGIGSAVFTHLRITGAIADTDLTMETAWNVFMLIVQMALVLVALAGLAMLSIYLFNIGRKYLEVKAEYKLKQMNVAAQHKHEQFLEEIERQKTMKKLNAAPTVPASGQWKGTPTPRRRSTRKKPPEEVIEGQIVY